MCGVGFETYSFTCGTGFEPSCFTWGFITLWLIYFLEWAWCFLLLEDYDIGPLRFQQERNNIGPGSVRCNTLVYVMHLGFELIWYYIIALDILDYLKL